MNTERALPQRGRQNVHWTVVLCLLAAVAAFYLWRDHQSHVLQALPYALLLACPAMHLLMHRKHRHH